MQNSDRCSAYNVGDNVGDNGGKVNKPSSRNNTDGIYNGGKHIGGAHTDRKNGKGSSPRFSILLRAAAVVFWLAVWQFGADAVGTEVLLPSPLAVLRRLFYLIREEDFLASVGGSLCRIMAGYLLAVLLGTLIGYLCERSRTAELLLSPLLSIITATPVASIIILTLVWIGKQLVPSLIVMLIVIPVVASHTRAGLAGIDRSLVSLCRIYGLPRTVVLRKLYLPSMLPDLSAGLSTALGLAWKSGVAAEVLAVPLHSIGANVYRSKLYLETTDLFAWTVTVILLSMLISKLLCVLIKRRGMQASSDIDGTTSNAGEPENGDDISLPGNDAADTKNYAADTENYAADTENYAADTGKTADISEYESDASDAKPIGSPKKHVGAAALTHDIALRGICKSYGDKAVLYELDLTLQAHRVTALTGASGIGKSTVMGVLCGEVKPDSGELLGLEPGMCAPVFQEQRLLPWHSALDNCALFSPLGKKRYAEALREASELLSTLGLDEQAQQKAPSQLSGGMNQRVAIARALISHRPLLLLDEPFRGLDPALKRRVIQVVLRHSDTVLLITHSPEEAEYMGAESYRLDELMKHSKRQ